MATMFISFEPKLKHVLYVDLCRNCGRYIKTDRVKSHESACRVKTQKLVFDITKQQKPLKKNTSQNNEKRKQFQNLMESIRQRGYSIDVSLPPPLINRDYIQCLKCLRRFNSDAAYRHIPKCPLYEFNKLIQNPKRRSKNLRRSR